MKIPLHYIHTVLFNALRNVGRFDVKNFHQNTKGWQMDLTCPRTNIKYTLQITPVNEEKPISEEEYQDIHIPSPDYIIKEGGFYGSL